MLCGPDLVTVTLLEECTGPCVHGATSAACALATCGDHKLQAPEVCDDGNLDNTDTCTNACKEADCGDGFVQSGAEECDDANDDDTDACVEGCKEAYCGDGFTWSIAEDCDDANDSNTDDCVEGCVEARCGDGHLQVGVEACDDGNRSDGDDCSASCRIETRLLAIDAKGETTCALNFNGVVKCWGDNTYGQLGIGSTEPHGIGPEQMGDSLPAVQLPPGRLATAISAGHYHACALLDDGTVSCWGRNSYGQLGLEHHENRGDSALPLEVVNLGSGRTATSVAAGAYFTCALLDDDTVKCWGRNEYGELGQGNVAPLGDDPGEVGDALFAVSLDENFTVKTVTAGYYSVCVSLSDDSVRCWGRNAFGSLGCGDDLSRGDEPGEVENLEALDLGAGTLTQLGFGISHACAKLSDSSFKCWGRSTLIGSEGSTDLGDDPNEMGVALPSVNWGAGRTVRKFGVGAASVCGILDNFDLKCFGSGTSGKLGYEDTRSRGDNLGEMGDLLPTINIGSGLFAVDVAVGALHACAVLNNGRVKCWGGNELGQLGLGDNDDRGSGPNQMGDNLAAVDLTF